MQSDGEEALDGPEQSLADAEHAVEFLHEQQRTTRVRLQHSIAELSTKAELAELDHGIAQDQLNAMQMRLTWGSGTDSSPPMTPKDEMNARIQERQRYLEMLDASFKVREIQIHLLRQTGQLQEWIQSVIPAAASVRQDISSRGIAP